MNEALTSFQGAAAALFPLVTAYVMVSDFRHRIIPNWASVVLGLAFLPFAVLGDMDGGVLAAHYGAGLALLVMGVLLFTKGIIGGGDVKIIAAAGVWFGFSGLGAFLLFIALFGGVLALGILMIRKLPNKPAFLATLPWLGDDPDIPYGLAIGSAALFLFFKIPVYSFF